MADLGFLPQAPAQPFDPNAGATAVVPDPYAINVDPGVGAVDPFAAGVPPVIEPVTPDPVVAAAPSPLTAIVDAYVD